MIEEKYINGLIEKFLEGSDKFLVELIIREGNIIEAYVDGDENISINDCIDISRELESSLNRDEDDYALRVSSYGADRPLVHDRQIKKAVGKRIKIRDLEGKKSKGELVEFKGDSIVFAEIKPPAKKGGREKRKDDKILLLSELEEIKREIMFR